MGPLAGKSTIEQKFVLQISLWDDEKSKIEEMNTVLKNDENVSFEKFRATQAPHNRTMFIILASKEEHLKKYDNLPVQSSRRC